MGQFINSLKDVSKNYRNFDAWDQARADETAKKEWLAANTEISPDKFESVENQAKAVIRATEIMDARSEDNCENMEQVMGLVATVPAISIPFLQTLGTPLVIKKIEKSFNKKRLDLTEKIKQLADSDPTKKNLLDKLSELMIKERKALDKASMSMSFGCIGLLFLSTIGLIVYGNKKQKEASRIGRFQAKQDELKGLENFVIYTPEQLAKAEEIANTIPDKKEKKNFAQMFKELKVMRKAKPLYKKSLEEKDPQEFEKLKNRNLSPKELQKANEQKELITKVVSDVNIKAEEYSENLENAFDTLGTISWLAAIPLALLCKKALGKFTKITKTKENIISTIVGTITGLSISILGTFEQKKSARIGRYHARQELLNNPERMMSFTEEEMNLAKDIHAEPQKKGLFNKIGTSFRFLKNYYNHKKEYKNYKKTTQKENEKLQQAFKQIELTAEQKQKAKNLQINVFRAFDEVDEMSQRYSEDVEAGTEIAKQTLSTGWSIGSLISIGLLGAGIYKGKVNLIKPLNGLVNLTFKKESTLRQAMNKFTKAVSKNGKKGRKEFQENLFSGKLGYHLSKAENAEIKNATELVKNEFGGIVQNAMLNSTMQQSTNFKDVLNNLFNNHFKEGKIAKWARNLTVEGSQLWFNNSKYSNGLTSEMKKELGINVNYKNYKTLWNTLMVSGIPILGTIFAVPFMFNAWLTDIQKKAGKIGVMEAVNKLDDPHYFANQVS